MKKTLTLLIAAALSLPALINAQGNPAHTAGTADAKDATEIRRYPLDQSRMDFEADRFGIFLHWGIYSMFGQGEWYLNRDIRADEYAKAAGAFYPANFDAGRWADAIRDAGAKYVCFTSRHHDGFSMFGTEQSPYNVVDATPWERDVLRELSDSLADRGLALHLYYSLIDWTRPDYPRGRTGRNTGVDLSQADWKSYRGFMDRQLGELLTGYGPIRCIWFDGMWDHDEDAVPFDWQFESQYALIHRLQPGCLVGNNHHIDPLPGEDIQIFERDIPGRNTAGYSNQAISRLPLETCQTMNGMWGYKVADTDYKSTAELIRLLVGTASMGANLLLNIGPRPDGSLPETALERLAEIGEWMRANGETIYGTKGSPFPAQPWGSATVKDDKVYLHITDPSAASAGVIAMPWSGVKVKEARHRSNGAKAAFSQKKGYLTVETGSVLEEPDHVIELKLDNK